MLALLCAWFIIISNPLPCRVLRANVKINLKHVLRSPKPFFSLSLSLPTACMHAGLLASARLPSCRPHLLFLWSEGRIAAMHAWFFMKIRGSDMWKRENSFKAWNNSDLFGSTPLHWAKALFSVAQFQIESWDSFGLFLFLFEAHLHALACMFNFLFVGKPLHACPGLEFCIIISTGWLPVSLACFHRQIQIPVGFVKSSFSIYI